MAFAVIMLALLLALLPPQTASAADPVFDPTTVTLTLTENTPADQDVGAAVTATDADMGDTLTYMLSGTDAASFTIVSATGQIRTKPGVTYDHEAKSFYSVTVTATDSDNNTATATVTINVTDVDEPPSAPSAPTLAAVSGSTTSLQVSWTAPSNTGKPGISSYDLRYRQGMSGDWTDGPQDQTGTSATISSLTANTRYEVQVRATNAEGDGPWSESGAGATSSSATSPTVSGIAVTSSPGADGEYTTLDVITVGVTFSEAVTVTGEPQLPLDIGGTERIAAYMGSGAITGQLLFSYTVQPVDQDDDGMEVKQSKLVLNGGTITAADDSAHANLTHSARGFSGHKVDTELVLIGNMEQTDGTALRINAGETVKLSFKYHIDSRAIYEGGHILLDVQTPSDTLTLTVTATTVAEPGTVHEEITLYPLSGSVAEAGMQAFRSDDFAVEVLETDSGNVELLLTATGSGYIEINTTSSTDEDEAKAYDWSIGDSFSKSTDGTTFAQQTGDLPRFSVIGHGKEVLRIEAAAVISEPADQAAYTAGEDIEVLVFTNAPPSPTTDSLTIPLQVGANVRQAGLVTIGGNFSEHASYRGLDSRHFRRQVMHFVYTVQPDDVATGVGIGADPLGSAGIEHAADSRFTKDLSFPAQAPAAGSRVNGSRAEVCDAIHCAYVTDRYSFLSFKHDRYAVAPGGQVTLTLVLDPAYPETFVLPLSLSLPTRYSGTRSQFTLPSSVTFNAGETEQSFTLSVAEDAPLTDEFQFVSLGAGIRGFLRSRSSTEIYITNSPESIEASLETVVYRGYTRPRHPDVLPWSILSNSTFHYDQRYVFASLLLVSYGTAEDDYFFIEPIVTQPLSKEARSRLGLVVGGRTLPFSEAHVQPFAFSGDRVGGIEEWVGYFLDGEGLRWEKNQRYAVRIVELPVTATFDAATYAADEGENVDVTVTLGGGFRGETVTLPITVSHNDGATTADYSGVPAKLVFAPGETEKSFTVTLIDDSRDDEGESITLSFGASEHIESGGTNETATISITDNDDTEAGFHGSPYTVAEGAEVSVTVQLTSALTGGVSIPITATGQGGATAEDYSGVPQSITFAAGETTKMFTFIATQDEAIEGEDSILLGFGTLPGGVQAGSTSRATVRIVDDDTEAGFGRSEYTVAEGGTVSVTVRLASALPRGITIPITATGLGGATGKDYSGVPQSIAFAAGETTKTFTFMATQDKSDDDGESVRLGLGLRPGIAADRHATATVAIRDDDTARVRVSTDTLTIPEDSSREYTVWLATVPDDTVVVTPHSSNPSVTFVPPTLTYTPDAWAVPQTVRAFAGGGGRVRGATLTHAVTGYGIVTEAPPVAVRIQLRPTPTPTPRPRPPAIPTPAPVVLPPWVPAAPDPTATPTPVPTPTPTATPTATPTPTPTPTPSATPAPPMPTATPTASPTPSPTPTAVPTAVPVVSPPDDGGGLPWWLWPLLLLALLAARWVYRRWRRRRRRQGERRWYG